MAARNGTVGFHSLPLRLASIFQPSSASTYSFTPFRSLHKTARQKHIPKPTPFVPDPKTFLTLIGRNMSRYAPKFESWDQLFSMSSEQLREEVGITVPRERRYLLRWLERFRQGRYGIGGDLDHVADGVAELQVITVPEQRMPGYKERMEKMKAAAKQGNEQSSPEKGKTTKKQNRTTATATLTNPPGMRYAVVNVPPSKEDDDDSKSVDLQSLPIKKYASIKLRNQYMIHAPFIEFMKRPAGTIAHGMHARLAVKEGMWEDKLGRKVDGGERKRDEVRAKRRAAERRERQAAATAEAAKQA